LYIYSDANIYIDTSGSMQGYLAKRGNEISAYTYLFLNLNQILLDSNILNVKVLEVGSAIFNTDCNNSLRIYGSNLGKYKRKSTNLVGAVYKIVGDGKLSLLITDSVLSTKSNKARKLKCDNGYDVVCMEKAFRALIDNGFAVELVGIKSLFKGKIYSEAYKYLMIGNPIINIKVPIYRPFFVYVIGKNKNKISQIAVAIEKRLNEFKDKYNISEIEVRRTKTAGFTIPKFIWNVKFPYEIRQYTKKRKGKKVYEIQKGACFVKSENSYKIWEKIKFNHYGKLYLPFNLLYEKEYISVKPKISISVSPKIQRSTFKISKKGDNLILYLKPAFIKILKIQRKGKITFRFCGSVLIKEEAQSSVWNDWSTEEDNLKDNSERILNLATLLTYVRNYSLEKVKKSPKKTCINITFRKN
jgi:hypothetical protein